MFSKYYGTEPTQSKNYGWKWIEADEGSDLYNNITNGSLRTSANVITSGIYVSATTDDNKRIYVKNHTKHKLINNEVFKLFTMQDIIEGYTTNSSHMLDIRYGLYNRTAGAYVDVNLDALRAWEAAGHKVTLRVRTPEDLSIPDIEASDMIVVGEPGDGGFKFANTWINGIKGTSGSGTFSMSNDITFPQAVAIYKKVVSEEASMAVPSAMATYGGTFGTSNLSKLFEMLFCFSNADIEREAVIDSTIKAAKEEKIKVQGSVNYWTVDPSYQSGLENRVITSGSGREIFSDYLKSMSNDALSKSLYEDETQVLKAKTTDIVYIGESGSDAGKIIVPSKNENIDGYDFKYTGYTISNWQGGGGGKDTLNPIESNLMLENKNKYLIDRYRIAYNGYDKNNTYVYNEDYGHLYKFYFEGSNEGIYRNQLIYNNDSPLLTFNKTGGTGSLALQTIKQNTHSTTKATQGDIIGTMEFVGADSKARADARRASQGNESSDTYEKSNVEYEMNVYKLANGIDKKVLYMTEAQFKRAQDEGLYLYVLIKTNKDSSNYNKCVIRYTTNDGKPGRYDYDNNQNSADNVDDNENVIKYKAGSGEYENFVREYRYHVHPWYFCNVTPAYNKGNNLFLAKIDAGGGKKYNGSDELYIFIRDTFDLD